MLKIKRCEGFYGSSKILHGVELSIGAGEAFAVLGRNGMGKTTLLKWIMGLLPGRRGALELQGVDLSRKPTYLRARSGIGYVPQNREILGGFSVRDNLIMGGYARSEHGGADLEDVLELFPVLRENLTREASQLSGGQQQQLAIARALVGDPKVLLLDEPTEGIQPNVVETIGRVIKELNVRRGLTIVLVEQQLRFARDLCSSFAILNRGMISRSGPIVELTDDVVREQMAV